MITDRIGLHEVLLPIYHNFNKICDIYKALFLNQNTRNSKTFFLASREKTLFKRARVIAYCPITLAKSHNGLLLWHEAYCPITGYSTSIGYTTTHERFCNFHLWVFQIKLKYHCSKPIKLQKFLM